MHPPADLSAWGNSAGWMPAESPVVRELPRLLEIGARIQFGGWSALQETAFGAVTFVGLTMVTFGGYASYTTGRAIWGGYKEFGILGALNALNPLYQLAKSAADTFMAADRGDWEAVGQGGVKTGVAAVGAAGAVAGIAGAVGRVAAIRVASSVSPGGAVRAYEVGTFAELQARSVVGDGLDLHHVGQAHVMSQVVSGYSRAHGPSIALPRAEHAMLPRQRGPAILGARDLLARDIQNLRRHTDTPTSSLRQIIRLNKEIYPEAFKK